MQIETFNKFFPNIIGEKTGDILNIRSMILDAEAKMVAAPGTTLGDNEERCPLKHTFSDGVYVRQMTIRKGTPIIGKIHKHECTNIILSGDITVVSEEGMKRIKAPYTFVSPPGVKRIGYAHEDTVWINVHSNPDNETDLAQIEERVIAKNYEEFENTRIGAETKRLINKTNMNTQEEVQIQENCGWVALRNLTEIKNISVKALVQMGEDNGLTLYPYKVPMDKLAENFPAIFHTDNHFIYVATKEEFDDKLSYTGTILLTEETDYTKIKVSEQKKITGASWAAAIGASVALTTAIAGNQVKKDEARPQCEKDCKTSCKSKHGALFSGRRKCIKGCRAECVDAGADMTPSPVSSGINWYYVAAGIIAVAATLLLIFRKKLFPKK